MRTYSQTDSRLDTGASQAEQLLRARRYGQAVDYCRAVLAEDPENLRVRLTLSRALMLAHHDVDAKTEMTRCLELDPECGEAYRLLAELALRHDCYDHARQFLSQALELDPEDRAAQDLLEVVDAMGASSGGRRKRSAEHLWGSAATAAATGVMRTAGVPEDLIADALGHQPAQRTHRPPQTFEPTRRPARTTEAPHRRSEPQAPTRTREPTPSIAIAPTEAQGQAARGLGPSRSVRQPTPSIAIAATEVPSSLAQQALAARAATMGNRGAAVALRTPRPEPRRDDWMPARVEKTAPERKRRKPAPQPAPRMLREEEPDTDVSRPPLMHERRGSSLSQLSRVVEALWRQRQIKPKPWISLRVFWSWSCLGLVSAMLLWGAFTAVRHGTPVNFIAAARTVIGALLQETPPPPLTTASSTPSAAAPAQPLATDDAAPSEVPKWLHELEADTWIHPLNGPVRRMPVRDGRVFGAERPGERPAECQSGHCGVDIGNTWGEPILAVHDGVVDRVQRGLNPDHGGRYVRLAHRGGTIITSYFHLSSIPRNIVPGTRIRAGQVIGYMGDTGVKASGPHLHFAIAVRPKNGPDRYFDPEPLLVLWPLRIPGRDGVATIVDANAAPGLPLGAHYSRKLAKAKKRTRITD